MLMPNYFFGVLQIVRVAIHDVNCCIGEAVAQSSSNPIAAAPKVKECSSSLSLLASATDGCHSKHGVGNVIGA